MKQLVSDGAEEQLMCPRVRLSDGGTTTLTLTPWLSEERTIWRTFVTSARLSEGRSPSWPVIRQLSRVSYAKSIHDINQRLLSRGMYLRGPQDPQTDKHHDEVLQPVFTRVHVAAVVHRPRLHPARLRHIR